MYHLISASINFHYWATGPINPCLEPMPTCAYPEFENLPRADFPASPSVGQDNVAPQSIATAM
jgi:hypothetical protein